MQIYTKQKHNWSRKRSLGWGLTSAGLLSATETQLSTMASQSCLEAVPDSPTHFSSCRTDG